MLDNTIENQYTIIHIGLIGIYKEMKMGLWIGILSYNTVDCIRKQHFLP